MNPIAGKFTSIEQVNDQYLNRRNVKQSGKTSNISFEDIEAIPVKGKSPFKKRPKTFVNNNNIPIKKIVDNSDNTKSLKKHHKKNLNLNITAQKIYDYISEEPVHIDKISSDLQIPVFKVLSSLTELEMNDLVTALQGRRYVIK